MMYVICFYWQGDRWQTSSYKEPEDHFNRQQSAMNNLGVIDSSLPAKYVNNLFRGVTQFSEVDFTFICFSNEVLDGLDSGIQLRPLPMVTREGVLPRLYMFSKAAGLFGHQVLCLDLDIVIVGSLKDIMRYQGRFCARSKFRPGQKWKLDGDVMSFRADKEAEQLFWNPFIEDIDSAEELTMGRERYWMRHVAEGFAERWDIVAPNQVLSYKWHVKNNEVPEGAAIISCHGVPRPHQIKHNWIKPYWK